MSNDIENSFKVVGCSIRHQISVKNNTQCLKANARKARFKFRYVEITFN